MPVSRPSHTTSRPAMDTMTQKSSYMSDAILNAPTLGPGDSLSCVSTKPAASSHGSSRPAPSYRSAAPLSTASARSSGPSMSHSSKMSSSSQSTIRPSSSSGLTGMPHVIPPPMSESSCSRRSSMLVPEGSRGGSSSYRSEAPSSHRSGLGPGGSQVSSSSRYSEAPLSLASHRSSHGPSGSHVSSSSRYSEAPLSLASHRSSGSQASSSSRYSEAPVSHRSSSRISEAGPLSLVSQRRSEAPLSMVSHDYRGTSSRPEASMVSTVSRQVSRYQPAAPSPLSKQVAAPSACGPQGNAMLGCIAAPAPRKGESVDITIIKIHASG